MNILVVEDELHIAELIQTVLEDLGNSCVLANTADDASRILADQPVDAVTLDLGMPGKSGIDWLEELAESRPELSQRTLVITGLHLGPDSVQRLAACGAGILAKPFTIQTLYDAFRCQLEHTKAEARGAGGAADSGR